MKFKKAISSKKLDGQKLSKAITRDINELNEAIATRDNLASGLDELEGDELEQANQQLEEINAAIEEADTNLAKKIIAYADNADVRKENIQRMQQAKLDKKNGKNQPPAQTEEERLAAEEQERVRLEQEQEAQRLEAEEQERVRLEQEQAAQKLAEEEEKKKKKSGGLGWVLFGAIALVLTAGAVNAFKNE